MTGRMPDEGVNPVEFPSALADVWEWFLRLNRKRPAGMSSVAPIPESEIGWFFANRGITPEGWVLDAIDRLDVVAMASATEKED